MNKRGICLILLVILIFSTGCSSRPAKTEEPSTYNFRTGTQGLELRFPVGTFEKLFEGENVKMIVEVRNKGAFPQPDSGETLHGRIWLGGFDKQMLDIKPVPEILDDDALEGKSQSNREGGYMTVLIEGRVSYLPEATPYYKPELLVSASYVYETLAAPNVCIDPNPRSTDLRQKVCKVYEFSSVNLQGSQGAPVAVYRIEEDVTSNSILFKIYVRNVGGGFIIDEDAILGTSAAGENPNTGYSYDNLNNVYIKEVTVGNRALECRPSVGQTVKLMNGEGIIFCKMSLAGIDSVFISQLNIKLRYGYTSSISRRIDILKNI